MNLICPHCHRKHNMELGSIRDWYESHVLACARAILDDAIRSRLRVVAEHLRLRGSYLLELFSPGGDLQFSTVGHNLIVNAGKDAIIDRLQGVGGPPAVFNYQAIGTGATAAAAGDTALQTEVARVSGTLSQPSSQTDRLVTTFAAGTGTGALTESGRLNAASSGTLLARFVFSVVNKAAGDSLDITHDITP